MTLQLSFGQFEFEKLMIYCFKLLQDTTNTIEGDQMT